MSKTAISFENYSFRYNLRERWTVLDLNVSISENEFVILTGPSGSGKSTFCYSILGLIPHFYTGDEKGYVSLKQEEVKKTSVSTLSEKIGYIPQRIENSFTTPYVISELAFPLEYRGYPRQEIAEIVETITKEIDLKKILYRKIENLSEGEKQKVAIGCALVTNPEIIIADEPTANLDNTNKKMILSILQNLHAEGKTVIVSTHEYKKYEEIATRLIELEEGKITRDTVLSNKEKKKQSGKSISIQKNKQYGDKNNVPDDKIIEIDNLSFEYPGFLDLTDITLTLNKGEIMGIIGENGSGKTSLIRLMCGLLKPKTGVIRIKNEEINQIGWKEITKNIGVVFQNPEIQFFEETVREEIGFIANNLERDISDQEISNLLHQSRLTEYEGSSPHSLSHGEKRRLAFLTAIYHNPDIIIVDEITNGLGEQNKKWLIEQFYELKRKGKTIIIVSHDWDWLADFVDSIAYLDQGRIKSVTDKSHLLQISEASETDKKE